MSRTFLPTGRIRSRIILCGGWSGLAQCVCSLQHKFSWPVRMLQNKRQSDLPFRDSACLYNGLGLSVCFPHNLDGSVNWVVPLDHLCSCHHHYDEPQENGPVPHTCLLVKSFLLLLSFLSWKFKRGLVGEWGNQNQTHWLFPCAFSTSIWLFLSF